MEILNRDKLSEMSNRAKLVGIAKVVKCDTMNWGGANVSNNLKVGQHFYVESQHPGHLIAVGYQNTNGVEFGKEETFPMRGDTWQVVKDFRT